MQEQTHNAALHAILSAVLLLLGAMLSPSDRAHAAYITAAAHPICQAQLSGEIVQGDVESLSTLFEKLPKKDGSTVCLNSPGGSFAEGISLGYYFAGNGISTFIDRDAACLSACAIAFMFGTDHSKPSRTLHVLGKLGFHAPFLVLDAGSKDQYSSSTVEAAYQAALVELAALLVHSDVEFKLRESGIGRSVFPTRMVVEMMRVGRDSLFYVDTVEKAMMAGISLYGFERISDVPKWAYINMCFHGYVEQFGEIPTPMGLAGNHEEGVDYVVANDGNWKTISGASFYVFEASISCSVSVGPQESDLAPHHNVSDADVNVAFVKHLRDPNNPQIPFNADDYTDETPIWYIFHPLTKLSCLSPEADAGCKHQRTRIINMDHCLGPKTNPLDEPQLEEDCPQFIEPHEYVGSSDIYLRYRGRQGTSADAPFRELPNVAFKYSGEESATVTDFEACKKRCLEDGTCGAFTYFKQRRLCRLMQSATEQISDRRTDSGIRVRPPVR